MEKKPSIEVLWYHWLFFGVIAIIAWVICRVLNNTLYRDEPLEGFMSPSAILKDFINDDDPMFILYLWLCFTLQLILLYYSLTNRI